MTIKEARKTANLSQLQASLVTGIPLKTLQHWEAFESNPESSGAREPSRGVKELVIEKILTYNKLNFKIGNDSVKNYAKICKKFSADTVDWSSLDEFQYYTTSNQDWEESSDNAHGGIDVSWAFQLSDEEIEMRAAEKLYEQLMNELELAYSDGWDSDNFKIIYDKYSF